MKVYVDELPKKCSDCPCFNWEEQECLASEEDNLWIRNKIDAYRFRHDKCPLQSIAEHDKQVRKEVVKEIKKEVVEATCYETEEEARRLIYDLSSREILEILDRIEGGENGKIN